MISADYTDVVISDIILALFEDTGLYKVNYYTGIFYLDLEKSKILYFEEKCKIM